MQEKKTGTEKFAGSSRKEAKLAAESLDFHFIAWNVKSISTAVVS